MLSLFRTVQANAYDGGKYFSFGLFRTFTEQTVRGMSLLLTFNLFSQKTMLFVVSIYFLPAICQR